MNNNLGKFAVEMAIKHWIRTGDPVYEGDFNTVYADWSAEGIYRADYRSDNDWINACWEKNGDKGIIRNAPGKK